VTDTFRSWQQEFAKKFEGGISDLRSEALEGAAIVKGGVSRARNGADAARLREFAEQISAVRIQKFTPSRSQVNWTY